MVRGTFHTIEQSFTMSEAEWSKHKAKILQLQRHHVRALRQLQLFSQRGVPPTNPLYVRAHKRLRHLERRIESLQHKLAHARRYEAFIEPEPMTFFGVTFAWIRQAWRTRAHRRSA